MSQITDSGPPAGNSGVYNSIPVPAGFDQQPAAAFPQSEVAPLCFHRKRRGFANRKDRSVPFADFHAGAAISRPPAEDPELPGRRAANSRPYTAAPAILSEKIQNTKMRNRTLPKMGRFCQRRAGVVAPYRRKIDFPALKWQTACFSSTTILYCKIISNAEEGRYDFCHNPRL